LVFVVGGRATFGGVEEILKVCFCWLVCLEGIDLLRFIEE
jgi:hypothetical protein